MRASGFTLIELLVTIGIIAVLAAVLIPILAGGVKQGNAAAARSQASAVQLTVNAWLAANPTLDATSLGTLDCKAATTLTATSPYTLSGNDGNAPGWPAAPSNIASCALTATGAHLMQAVVTTTDGARSVGGN